MIDQNEIKMQPITCLFILSLVWIVYQDLLLGFWQERFVVALIFLKVVIFITCKFIILFLFLNFCNYISRLLRLLYSTCWWLHSMLSLLLFLEVTSRNTSSLVFTNRWYVTCFCYLILGLQFQLFPLISCILKHFIYSPMHS